jgi:hypothetical protein
VRKPLNHIPRLTDGQSSSLLENCFCGAAVMETESTTARIHYTPAKE